MLFNLTISRCPGTAAPGWEWSRTLKGPWCHLWHVPAAEDSPRTFLTALGIALMLLKRAVLHPAQHTQPALILLQSGALIK